MHTGPYPSSSLRVSQDDLRAPSPTPSFGTSSLSSYSGREAYSSRASSQLFHQNEVEVASKAQDYAVSSHAGAEADAGATSTPPASPVIHTGSGSHSTKPPDVAGATPGRVRKRSNTVISASNALRRVSNLLGVSSRQGSNSTSTGAQSSSACVSASTPPVPSLNPADTPPARAIIRPCGRSVLESPSTEPSLSPSELAPPTPSRKRSGSITASVSALTRACTATTSLKDSPVTPGGGSGWRSATSASSAKEQGKDSPSPIRFAPNSNVMSPQTPTGTRNTIIRRDDTESPRTPTSAGKNKKRPMPLALLPALTPTRSRPHTSGATHSPEDDGQQLPTPASLFVEPTPAPASSALASPHTPGRSVYRGMHSFISSSEVSLGAVGSTPRSAGTRHAQSQSVPALGAPWEEPQAMRKMSVASASVLTPPPSGRVVGSGASSMTTTKLDWPSLDEAYYPAQHATSSAPSSPQGEGKPPSGSPHTPGGLRSGLSPGSNGGRESDARERARQEAEERLSASPAVLAAVSRLVAACGQMSASVQRPFLTVCDAAMGVSIRGFL